MITRRTTLAALAAFAASPAAASPAPDPQLFVATRGAAMVYLMGFASAKDRGWLTPKIAKAADESAVLWVEVAPIQVSATPSPVITERGYDRERDLFQVLPTRLSERLLAAATKLGVTRERLAPMRPWLARQALQRAFAASQAKPGGTGAEDYPDQAMIARFQARGAPVRAEFPTLDAVLNGFADYPQQAQFDDLRNLLDYIDDEARGSNDVDGFTWLTGKPTTRYIDRMRLETPALYQASHVGRNRWWGEQIDKLLGEGGVTFVLVGQNHMLGPESIPVNLKRRRIPLRRV